MENLERFELHTPTASFHFSKLQLLHREQGNKCLWICCCYLHCLPAAALRVCGA